MTVITKAGTLLCHIEKCKNPRISAFLLILALEGREWRRTRFRGSKDKQKAQEAWTCAIGFAFQ